MNKKKRKRKELLYERVMLWPAVVLFGVFFLLPIIESMALSFTNWNGFSKLEWIGLKNFTNFFSDDRAVNAVVNTLIYGISGSVLLNLLGLVYALLLDVPRKMSGVVRTLIYLPNIISPLIMGYVWKLILSSEKGVLKVSMDMLGSGEYYRDWLGDPKAAIVVIIIINLWQCVGGTMMIYLAGLQNINMEVLESARVDGANFWQMIRSVKLPLLAPAFRINIVTNIIGCMSIFDIIMSLTGGGPGFYTESLSVFILKKSVTGNSGYAAAVSIVLFLIILLPAGFAFAVTKRMEENNAG